MSRYMSSGTGAAQEDKGLSDGSSEMNLGNRSDCLRGKKAIGNETKTIGRVLPKRQSGTYSKE